MSINWTEEAEVVVVGYGGAGAVAAIAAADAGANSVIIMEKNLADTPTCTNHTPSTRMSGGGFLCPEDAERTWQYLLGLRRIANEPADSDEEAILKVMAERMVNNARWMEAIGGVVGGRESQSPTFALSDLKVKDVGKASATYDADFPELPGSDAMRVMWMAKSPEYRHGAAFFNTLSNAVEKRNIRVLWATPAEHLVVEDGAVRGVIGIRDGQPVAVKATRGVVLACGGFEYNDFMKRNYLRPLPIEFTGHPGNTGDGINMALEIGAALWHMNCISYRVTIKAPQVPVALGTLHHSQMSIFVDKRGNRFSNEKFKGHAFGYELAGYDGHALCYPRIPCYWIFDEKRRKLAPLAGHHGACNPPRGIKGPIHYIWSEDNSVEIEKGWVWKADTIEELGRIIAADADNNGLLDISNLKATVERYNQFCRDGVDLDFHRPKAGLAPLEDPPYYALKLWPGGPNTQGGPLRNIRCQVLRPDRTPIPRLYAGGELGSFFGMLYNGGGNLGEIIAMASLAGENVAQEELWN
ncbi:MAG TPA: FAD-binding protein [Anaerolineae bacterium]|nr:FAD-binding protein [Anaerolineae bacterium]HOQ98018.1 FAD-binding protein [Anaerolineae bacterium]HPL30226.1 FAD-binding protein [Anaerolineae bacterium]